MSAVEAAEDFDVEEQDSEAEAEEAWFMGRSLGLEVEAEDEVSLMKALRRINRRQKQRLEGSKQKKKDGISKH